MTGDLRPETRVRPRPDVLFRELGEEAVVLDPESGIYYGLNEVGTTAWKLLAGGSRLGEVKTALLAAYDAPPERIWSDLIDLIHDLSEHRLVEVLSASST
ncbi:MAG TPA: PqqD family protein [Thermoanaerobaculia bacterium]|nr:PqqD family protein [Thermoanaerobaculia bacterium]